MMRYIGIVLAFILCLSISMGCRTVNEVSAKIKFPSSGKVKVKHKGHGPPPHAPAHGYRHKNQQGLELEFDSGLGVYFAIEMPGVYFYNGLYIQFSGSQWVVAAHFNGPWRVSLADEVPLKLGKTKNKGHKGKGKGRGKKKKKW